MAATRGDLCEVDDVESCPDRVCNVMLIMSSHVLTKFAKTLTQTWPISALFSPKETGSIFSTLLQF